MGMYYKFLTFLTFLFFALSIFAQDLETEREYRGSKYRFYTTKIDSLHLKGFEIKRNVKGLPLKSIAKEETINPNERVIIINACISDSLGNCVGLFIQNFNESSSINLENGSGNFYLKPNGVLIVGKNNIEIIESTNYVSNPSPFYAVQSGPLLIVNDTINKAFNPNSTNRNFRSGVGIYEKDNYRYIIYVTSSSPITFYEFASFLKSEFNCKFALSLESANSILFDSENELDINESSKVVANYIKIVAPLAAGKQKRSVVKMQLAPSGLYSVPVEINGVLKISFILDSGASDVSISPDIALTLIKAGTITSSDYIGVREYVFANGAKATSRVFNLKQIKIGDFIFKNIRATISNSISSPMLLGQSLLQKLGNITIDNSSHELVITKK